MIPGSGSSPGEGIGYPLQYSWASLLAQMVKNQPAMWETWVRSLGWEDPLEKRIWLSSRGPGFDPWVGKKETATHSSILAWEIHGQRSLLGHGPQGHK